MVTADAATYELMKTAAQTYYNGIDEPRGQVHVTQVNDKTGGVVVQLIIRVNAEYTLNFYNTTSGFLINGRNIKLFLETDLLEIQRLAGA